MAGSPDHSREQLRKMLEASKMLEQASQGQLNGLTDHVYQTEGKLTPEAEMRLREMVGKTRQEVDQLIQFVLQASQNLSNLSSSGQDSQAASRVQKKYETGRFERVLPLPGQTLVSNECCPYRDKHQGNRSLPGIPPPHPQERRFH